MNNRKKNPGFTLVELLVVIAIIGILAGLVVGLAGPAMTKMRTARVRAEIQQVQTAIESYKARMNFYPPDNGRTNDAVRPFQNQLYYELTGVSFDGTTYTARNGHTLRADQMQTLFGRSGIVNSTDAQNFFPAIKPAQLATNSGLVVLVAPVELERGQPNPWRYISTNPTNNPGGFDLWAEFVVRGKTNIIGNWQD